jgi:hypothetical protein
MKDTYNKNLLASIAVFGELCNTEQDVQSIIIEFIKSVYAFEKLWTLTTIDVITLLKKHFDFDFPEAVVKFCLNQMKKNNQVEKIAGQYRLKETDYDVNGLSQKIEDKRKLHGSLQDSLIYFYESEMKTKTDLTTKKELIENLLAYLFDNGVDEKYSTVINTFVLKNSSDSDFKETLSQIKEGLIITTGLKYTSDITSLGKWTDELNIYLDTEIIFNAFGFNGEVYKKLFDDFFSLVNEINYTSIKSNKGKLIKLKYFESTKKEIDYFFYGAQKVIRKEQNIAPLTTAMFEICKGCSTIDDVIFKKAQLETDLISMGICEVKDPNYLDKNEFIVESLELIEKYSKSNGEDSVTNILETFSKINYLRKGKNKTNFETCKHIVLTGKILSLQLSQDIEVKDEINSIPYSTDIYFITNRFWFKLNKGFSKKDDLPATLDMTIKAQIVLSSQINSSVKSKFNVLLEDLKSGKLSSSLAQNYYFHLRETAKKPEDLSSENVSKSISFIFEDDYDIFEREQAYKNQQIVEGIKAKNELRKYKNSERKNKNKIIKKKIRREFVITVIIFYILIIIIFAVIIFLLSLLISPTDSLFSILVGVITISTIFFPLLNKDKIRDKKEYLKKKLYKKYLKKH